MFSLYLSQANVYIVLTDVLSVFLQARTFYQSCVKERETTAPEDLLNLQAVLEFAGGWELSGSQNASMLLSERMFRLQNQLGS